MTKYLLMLVVLLVGCSTRTRITTSQTLKEDGRVIDTLHTIPHTEHDIDVGFDTDGNPTFTPTTTTIPETWGIVFRCEHGNKFVIQGFDDKYKHLWNKLDPGMDVTIFYKEMYRIKEEKNESNEWIVTSRVLTDYDFIDASPTVKGEVDIFNY